MAAGRPSGQSGSVPLTATARAVPGTLQQDVEIDGRHHLTTDEPESVGGDGSGPSPHELLPAALAACISTQLVMYARTKGWDLGEVSVEVVYDHRSTPRRFEIDISLGADLAPEQLSRLDAVAAACPVRRAIEGGVEFTERVHASAHSAA
jgi:putative redox protein